MNAAAFAAAASAVWAAGAVTVVQLHTADRLTPTWLRHLAAAVRRATRACMRALAARVVAAARAARVARTSLLRPVAAARLTASSLHLLFAPRGVSRS